MLEKKNISVETKDEARKLKIDQDAAWQVIERVDAVIIGKGKKFIRYTPDESNKAEILKAALGRSGNLRAPTLESDKTLIVGYNEALYDEVVH